jgi:hypothetical protein
MKSKIIALLFSFSCLSNYAQFLKQKVGSNPTMIQSSAVLEIESTTKGFLLPRMTETEMNAITAPATGLIVYCTNCNPVGFMVYTNASWKKITGNAITYQTSSITKPSPSVSGDMLFVTSTGTQSGIIKEQWLYDGTTWILIQGVYPISGVVIDNTITDPSTITTVGRYIVPATGLAGVFIGNANKYADFDGTSWTFSTPANNDNVSISNGTNANKIFKYTLATNTWAEVVSPVNSVPPAAWVLSNAYTINDWVIKDNKFYRPNAAIPANTAFVEGKTGATWYQVNNAFPRYYDDINNIINFINWNKIDINDGLVFTVNGNANLPAGVIYGILFVQNFSAASFALTLIDNNGIIYKRNYGTGSWGNWIKKTGFDDWVLSKAYNTNDIVINNNKIYKANGTIPANTTFAVGTSGATWIQVNENVLSATKLTTPRNINGVAFDGTSDITITSVPSSRRLFSSLMPPTSNNYLGMQIYQSSEFPGFEAWRAFEGNSQSATNFVTDNFSWQINFNRAVTLTQVWWGGNNSDGDYPTNLTLETWNPETGWVVQHTITGATLALQSRTLNFVTCLAFRFNVTASTGGNYPGFSKVRFDGF